MTTYSALQLQTQMCMPSGCISSLDSQFRSESIQIIILQKLCPNYFQQIAHWNQGRLKDVS